MKTYYIHTLDGKPAYFVPGQGLCFMAFFGEASTLCRSLKEIRQQQRESARLNPEPSMFSVGHLRVRLP